MAVGTSTYDASVTSAAVVGAASLIAFLWGKFQSNSSGELQHKTARMCYLYGLAGFITTFIMGAVALEWCYFPRWGDGDDYNYGRWVAIGLSFIIFSFNAAFYLWQKIIAMIATVGTVAFASTFIFLSGFISGNNRYYLFAGGAAAGLAAFLLMVLTANRKGWKVWFFYFFNALIALFLVLVHFLSRDMLGTMNIMQQSWSYAAGIMALLVVPPAYSVLTYEPTPSELASAPIDIQASIKAAAGKAS